MAYRFNSSGHLALRLACLATFLKTKLTVILLKLLLQALEQGERVRSGTSETADDIAFAKRADFLCIGLHNGVAHRDLSVSRDDNLAALAHREDRRAVPCDGVAHDRDMGARGGNVQEAICESQETG